LKTKSLLPFILALLIAGTLSGCNNLDNRGHITDYFNTAHPASPSPTGSRSAVAIEIYHCKTEFKDALEKAANKFMSEHDNVIVKTKYTDDMQNYSQTVRTMINSGQGPDIFNLMGPSDTDELLDKLADLTDMKVIQHVLKRYTKCVTVEDKIYGVPCSIEGYGLIYNKEIFEKAKIDVREIDSYDAFVKAVMEIDQMKEQLKLEAVFAFPAKDTRNTGEYMSSIFLSAEFNGDSQKAYHEKNLEFKYAEAFKQMVDLQNKYSIQPSKDIDAEKQAEYFAKGKVAIIQQSNWILPILNKIDSEFASSKIDIMSYPIPGIDRNFNVLGANDYWGINNASVHEEVETAKDFINWLYLSEEGLAVLTKEYKLLPAIKGISADYGEDPITRYIITYAASEDTNVCIYMGYPKNWGTNVLGESIRQYVGGRLSWDDVVKNAKAAWEKARKEQSQ